MREPLDDLANMEFRRRGSARPAWRRSSTQVGWILLSVIMALCFVGVIRMLFVRTAWSAGPSPVLEPVASGGADGAADDVAAVAPLQEYEAYPTPRTGMVYRCVASNGAVSLQSQPCGPDERTTKTLLAPPEREPPRRVATTSHPSRTASTAQYARVRHGGSSADYQHAQCAQAQRTRDDALERAGLSRTYDLLQQLDEMVRAACGQ